MLEKAVMKHKEIVSKIFKRLQHKNPWLCRLLFLQAAKRSIIPTLNVIPTVPVRFTVGLPILSALFNVTVMAHKKFIENFGSAIE